MGRRKFLGTSGLAAVGALTGGGLIFGAEEKKPLFSAMGTSGGIGSADELKQIGAQFLTENTSRLLMPDQSDEKFAPNIEKVKKAALPVLACNGFIRPKHLKCVGPDANHEQVLEWAERAFRRLAQIEGKFMVFGSSGARRIPDGWSRKIADEQFVELLSRMGLLAGKHKVTLVVEQLNERECNFITRISEGARLVRAANHPNVRLLADFYHMAVMEDGPDELEAAMDVVVHTEIAEKKKRSYPGVDGQDFRPYFRVLRKAGYRGAVSIEGRGTNDQMKDAFAEITRQAADV